ncbi:MAG: OmpA family protein [Deltaproteobacteria bacterium]|nr:OmpA family protein [Deltaproteobacteria bacterium]
MRSPLTVEPLNRSSSQPRLLHLALLSSVALLVCGCPKQVPQPEIDAAEQAVDKLDQYKDCAPETYQAAQTMMARARALLKEKRYEEAKPALLAVAKLVEKAERECDEKRKQAEEAARREQAEREAREASRETELPSEPTQTLQLKTVQFGFNTSDLTDESRATLGNNAEYLRQHAEQRVQIEGHCDSRGSTEYNLALGERRALSVKQYLIKLGIEPNRMEIISYGKERLLDPGQDDEAHARNRRAEFLKLK